MQAYGDGFARVYNQRWTQFARQTAPVLLNFFTATPAGEAHRSLLDLGCGTGQLAHLFLERGFRVTGLDLSAAMLEYARELCADYIATGQARFERGDIARFSMADHFGLVTATYDVLNHLEDLDALRQCFRSVFPLLVDEGKFIFDLNTRLGLRRWTGISVEDSEELCLITRGVYDEHGGRAWLQVSGFTRAGRGTYQRFEESVSNTAFDLAEVRAALLETGWASVYCAHFPDLDAPLDDPEREGRVFFVAHK